MVRRLVRDGWHPIAEDDKVWVPRVQGTIAYQVSWGRVVVLNGPYALVELKYAGRRQRLAFYVFELRKKVRRQAVTGD